MCDWFLTDNLPWIGTMDAKCVLRITYTSHSAYFLFPKEEPPLVCVACLFLHKDEVIVIHGTLSHAHASTDAVSLLTAASLLTLRCSIPSNTVRTTLYSASLVGEERAKSFWAYALITSMHCIFLLI